MSQSGERRKLLRKVQKKMEFVNITVLERWEKPKKTPKSRENGIERSGMSGRWNHRRHESGVDLHVPGGSPGLRPLLALLLRRHYHNRRQPRLRREPRRQHRAEARGRAPQRRRLRRPHRARHFPPCPPLLLQLHRLPPPLHALLRLLRSRLHGRIYPPLTPPALLYPHRRGNLLASALQFHRRWSPLRLRRRDPDSAAPGVHGLPRDHRCRVVHQIARVDHVDAPRRARALRFGRRSRPRRPAQAPCRFGVHPERGAAGVGLRGASDCRDPNPRRPRVSSRRGFGFGSF